MSCLKLGPGDKAPEIVNALIEIPMGGNVKYELDKEHCLIKVDRFLYTSMVYPFNYGFVPGTLAEDGDPIDIIVLSREPVYPGSIIEVKPVGMLIMEDEAGVDTKIIAVPKQKLDPLYGSINDITDVPDITKDKIKHFFEHYKELEPGKWVKLKDWLPAKNAKEEIIKAVERYNPKQ